MIKLNTYIIEAWSGVKKQSYDQEIKSWCEKMSIKKYTINSKGEIDVDGGVNLRYSDFKELPYKFGKVDGYFSLQWNEKLISLKNCPNEIVKGYFNCEGCTNLDSLKGCPEKVGSDFFCGKCKRNFTKQEVKSLCKVKKDIYI